MTRTTEPAGAGFLDRARELRAASRRQDAELWFSSRTRSRAVTICRTCPVLAACRRAVLRREQGLPRCQRSGIVAGLTGSQRYDLERGGERAERSPSDATPTGPGAARNYATIPAPCGTRAAYQRHLRRREPVDEACRAANARSAVAYRRTGSTRGRQAGPGPPRGLALTALFPTAPQ
ncbi:MAG: WhiB family transcriptional regulator [Streptomyces sp.]|nr:WhiB family transcriptional regulator [Streptomyces sp.]